MNKLMILSFALATTAQSAAAADVSFGLRVSVPTVCNITNVVVLPNVSNQLQISTNCNAAAFKLVMNDTLASKGLASASSRQASTAVQQDGVFMQPSRPGAGSLVVTFEDDLVDLQDAQIMIEAY